MDARAITREEAEVAPKNAHGRLFRKYAALVVGLVSGVLLASGAIEAWFSYQETRAMVIRIQREKAASAAAVIKQFMREIENQIEWSMHSAFLQGAEGFEQRRIDYLRLLRQSPAITQISFLDPAGKEQLRVSRLSMDMIGSGADFSRDPKFTQARPNRTYVSPVYFRKESEPYTTISMASSRKSAGITVAEVNLKFIWDKISQIKAGRRGYAYLVDSRGLLIAHPDIGLVLRKTDLSRLDQVRAILESSAETGPDRADVPIAANVQGKTVLTAYARIEPLAWTVFVESPIDEAFGPLYDSLARTAILLLIGLALSVAAGLVLARRITVPIRALEEGAARIGAGDLSSRIAVGTGDELGALAGRFNQMATELQTSYATLEQKVEERTHELSEALVRLEALGEVGEAVRSSLNLERVLETIVSRAVDLSATDAGAVYVFDEESREFRLQAAYRMGDDLIRATGTIGADAGETAVGLATRRREAVQIPDVQDYSGPALGDLLEQSGYRALLAVPLLREDRVVGALVVRRKQPGPFGEETIDVLQTFATQSVLPIQNARLFRDIEEKGREIEIASQHKSQFLANMSHELRTPLNAILGYTELILDEIYGPATEKVRGVLERVQSNGRHLLELINDVLDLTKIEAGELELSLNPYSMPDVVQTVVTATESLAAEKKLAVGLELSPELPTGEGDERRITQVLLNLVGNAIKFTDAGRVDIRVCAENGMFDVAVADTGPGIARDEQEHIFEEFQQVDNSSTKEKGGTGLGLAIAKRIVEMHGGRIWVESDPGEGATFHFSLPLHVEQPETPS